MGKLISQQTKRADSCNGRAWGVPLWDPLVAPLVAPLGTYFVVLLGDPSLVILGVRSVVPLGDLLGSPLVAPLGPLIKTLRSSLMGSP